MPNITPPVQGWGNRAIKKTKKLRNFKTKFCDIKASHWRILLYDFNEILRDCRDLPSGSRVVI